MMNMKSFTSAALAVVLSVSVMSVPAMAAPQVRSNSDIGISYVKHTGSNAVTGQSTLYHGQAYTATLEQMAAKLAQGLSAPLQCCQQLHRREGQHRHGLWRQRYGG